MMAHDDNMKISLIYDTLGVWFVYNAEPNFHYKHNFKPILSKMQACCNSWTNRSLLLQGKVTVLNVLVSSLLQYMCSMLNMPSRVFEEVKTLASAFLLGERSQQGGLHHPHTINRKRRTKADGSRNLHKI